MALLRGYTIHMLSLKAQGPWSRNYRYGNAYNGHENVRTLASSLIRQLGTPIVSYNTVNQVSVTSSWRFSPNNDRFGNASVLQNAHEIANHVGHCAR
jgi:hypothetical protein